MNSKKNVDFDSEKSVFDEDEKDRTVFVEVTPHHLFLTKDDEKNSYFKMLPGLKINEDQFISFQD